jgi:hypothetical protein
MSVKQLRHWLKLMEDDEPAYRYVMNLWKWAKKEPKPPQGVGRIRARILRLHLRGLLLESESTGEGWRKFT